MPAKAAAAPLSAKTPMRTRSTNAHDARALVVVADGIDVRPEPVPVEQPQ